jgi:DNA repair protein RadA/Sms
VGGEGADPAAPPPACFGELGLTGEVRPVAHPQRRLAEAARFGLDPVISPDSAGDLRSALRAALPRPARAAA